MDTEFLVQMRQSNKSGSVRNDEISNLHLGSGAGPWVSIPCLLQGTSHIYGFHPPKQLTSKKQRTQKWDSTSNKSYRTVLVYVHRTQGSERQTWNPALKEVMIRSTCCNKAEKLQKKTSRIVQPGLTYGSQHLER